MMQLLITKIMASRRFNESYYKVQRQICIFLIKKCTTKYRDNNSKTALLFKKTPSSSSTDPKYNSKNAVPDHLSDLSLEIRCLNLLLIYDL